MAATAEETPPSAAIPAVIVADSDGQEFAPVASPKRERDPSVERAREKEKEKEKDDVKREGRRSRVRSCALLLARIDRLAMLPSVSPLAVSRRLF